MNSLINGDPGPRASLSPDLAQAYLLLQERAMRATTWISAERYERALDELLRHPSRTGDPQKLANAAWGNAGKVVRSRAKYMTAFELKGHDLPDDENVEALVFEIFDFIGRSTLTISDQTILYSLLLGLEAEDIANEANTPIRRVSVWISRARKRARAEWVAA